MDTVHLRSQSNVPIEIPLTSDRRYDDIFNDVEVDIIVSADGGEWKVPAFWAGDGEFRVRFAAPRPGTYTFRSVCSNPDDRGLHGQTGEIEVTPYEGSNPLYRTGRLRVAPTRRTFEHSDGAPFLWLGDTWWMGLCSRLSWPDDFQRLAEDRVSKGFSVIQIVAGLYPDMPWGDERGMNEAGFPWESDFSRVNPAYFDMADRRIEHLVESGLVPCIVGCWGYFLPWMGVERMKKHWRYLIARWGAYPVVWCLAGEGTMPYYLSEHKEQDRETQKKGWTELAGYVRETDPFHSLITIHPTNNARDQVDDPSLLDFDMLQTGHSDRQSIPNTVKSVVQAYNREPIMPVINGEVCYEGIGEASRQEVQRLMFWVCMLSGAAGHTYGANGMWQVNTREKPYGPSPHGMSWGDTPWEDAYQLPGSRQLGIAKRLLERYEWWRFEPHPEWIEPHWNGDNYLAGYAAGIPGEVRIIFSPSALGPESVRGIEEGVPYRAFYFNPATGAEHPLGPVSPDADGNWAIPKPPPIYQDWITVLERDTG